MAYEGSVKGLHVKGLRRHERASHILCSALTCLLRYGLSIMVCSGLVMKVYHCQARGCMLQLLVTATFSACSPRKDHHRSPQSPPRSLTLAGPGG